MMIHVELIGVLRTLADARTLRIELDESALVSGLLQKLSEEVLQHAETLCRSNLLILKNGVEVNVLKGVHTELKNHDTITLVPISHGG
jgi:molybdopterin converting factor small subunit